MNLGDPSRVRYAKRKAKDGQRALDADLRWLLAQPQGRRYIAHILQRSGIEQSAVRDSTRLTDLVLGGQAIGFWLREQIDRVDPAVYGAMRTELLIEERNERRPAESTESDAGADGRDGDGPADAG